MDLASTVARAADTIHWAFDEHQLRLRAVTRRVRQRFERCDWLGIRQDTVERLDLHPRGIARARDTLREQLGGRMGDRATWTALKEAYTREIIGRNDFELAQTFFNSLTRLVFPRAGVDPAIDYCADDFPLPYKGVFRSAIGAGRCATSPPPTSSPATSCSRTSASPATAGWSSTTTTSWRR